MRAGRALGMILRDEVDGKPLDIRQEGRWSIGAEILLLQDADMRSTQWRHSPSPSEYREKADQRTRAWPRRKSFKAVKRYYENLIVQYPFQKRDPSAVSSSDFYSAMFRLWISVVRQEVSLRDDKARSIEDESDEGFEHDPESRHDLGPLIDGSRSSEQEVSLTELEQASEIADKLDSIMQTYPYREDPTLQELERIVHLWIEDLQKASTPSIEQQEAKTS